MANHTFFSELTHEGVLSVTGPDAAKFLQGQLTCNIDALSPERSSLGARCNAKGRVLATFRIINEADSFLLSIHISLLGILSNDLKKYAVFSKCALADHSDRWQRFGISAEPEHIQSLGFSVPQPDTVSRHNGQFLIGLSDKCFELWIPKIQTESMQRKLQEILTEAPLNDWQLRQIESGIGHVSEASSGLFVPQMLNLQAVGGVSFRKGCYTGQEIVARTQYLGKLKRRLYRFGLSGTSLPAPGEELFSAERKDSAGSVVLSAFSPQGAELLAVVQEDMLTEPLQTQDGRTLALLPLPYQLNDAKNM